MLVKWVCFVFLWSSIYFLEICFKLELYDSIIDSVIDFYMDLFIYPSANMYFSFSFDERIWCLPNRKA